MVTVARVLEHFMVKRAQLNCTVIQTPVSMVVFALRDWEASTVFVPSTLREPHVKREKFSHAQSVMIMQSASMEVVFAKLDTLEMGILARSNLSVIRILVKMVVYVMMLEAVMNVIALQDMLDGNAKK